MRYGAIIVVVFLMSLGMPVPPAEGENCALSKDVGPVPLVERSLISAEKMEGAEAFVQSIGELRSRLNAIKQNVETFPAKALPVEQECEALTGPERRRLRDAKQKHDADYQAVSQQREALIQDYNTNFLPRYEADQQDIQAYKSQCERKFGPDEKAAWEACQRWRAEKNPITEALQKEQEQYTAKDRAFQERLREIDAEYDKVFLPLKERYEKYKAALDAYNAEREACIKDFRQVWLEVNTLIKKIAQANEKGRQDEITRTERLEIAQKLRGQVKGIQEALRRLNVSMQGDAKEREQWEKATNQAMENAWDRGKGMIVDESLGVLGDRLDKQLTSTNEQIKQAVDRMAGTTDPSKLEQFQAAVKLMKEQRDEIEQAKTIVVDRLKDAKQTTDTVDYATSDPGDLEKSLSGTMEIVKTTLGDPKIQKALKIGENLGRGIGYAQSIIDSSYDITTEVVGWKRINQLNRNSDEYLKAVNGLKDKMESTMKKIHELEGNQ